MVLSKSSVYMFGVAMGAVLVTAQTPGSGRPGASSLVLPLPGVPRSLEQVEEYSRTLDDGTTSVETINSKIHRDHAGRVRTDSETHDGSGHRLGATTLIIDPVVGSIVIMKIDAKTALRLPGPKGETLVPGRLIADDQLSTHELIITRENVGKRTIEGFVFEGTRITQTAEDQPLLKYTIEEWYSDELKLTAVEVASGPSGTHTARIQDLHCEEPDPALFTIPSDYQIVDLNWPSKEGR